MPRVDNDVINRQSTLNLELINDESINNIPTKCNLKFYRDVCIILGISTIVTIGNILITNYIIDVKKQDEFSSCSC